MISEPKELPDNGVQTRLLDAAERVAVRDGVPSVTLEAVAREAGVSKGGLLYHFPSKAKLILAVVERRASQCDADQTKLLLDHDGSPGGFTRAYIAARTESLDPKHEPIPKREPIHAALLAAAGTDPQYLEPFRERARAWQKRLESDGIDPADAMIVRLAIDGLCLQNLIGMPVPEGELRHRIFEKLSALTRRPFESEVNAS